MGFRLEKLTEEEYKKYGFPPMTEEEKAITKDVRFTIDRDNNIFLKGTAYDMDQGHHYYTLFWKNERVEIVLIEKHKEVAEGEKGYGKINPVYVVLRINLIEKLKEDLEHIKEVIHDALMTRGWNCNPERTGITNVEAMDNVKITYM